jgi:hypothetical protein
VVASGAVAADAPADLVTGVARALAELLLEHAQLARGVVERPVRLGPALADGLPEVLGGPARELRPGGADRLEGMGVAVAHLGEPVVRREAHDPIVPRSPEHGRVERLDRVGMDGGVRVVEQAAEHPALGAQRVGHERVGGDRQAAGLVDGGDGRPHRAIGLDGPVDADGQQVPAEGRDLFPDDDLGAQAAVAGHRPGGDGRIDPLVVGDGDDVEVVAGDEPAEDRLDVRRAVGGDRVDVQVRPSRAPVVGHGAVASRSGQIGKKTAHHCSGASAMTRSNARATDGIVPVIRSRRVPSAGTATGSSRPM